MIKLEVFFRKVSEYFRLFLLLLSCSKNRNVNMSNQSYPFLLIIALLFSISTQVWSQNGSRTYVYDSPPPPFLPDEAQLNELIDGLKCSLSDAPKSNKLGQYFFDLPMAEQYIAFLESKEYPQINQNMAPVFVQWSSIVKNILSTYSGKIRDVKVVAINQRFGTDSSMKIVSPTVHFILSDGSLEQHKLMLIDFNGYYRILNFEE